MLKQRAASAESTRKKIHEALDRFEARELKRLPEASKLTIRNLAVEAEVSKDTPLIRYPKNHTLAGQHRFPDIVKRFQKLKERLSGVLKSRGEEKEIKRLRGRIKELDQLLLLSARANNLLDAETGELRRRNKELEEDNARLRGENAFMRQKSLKLLPL